MAKSVLHARLSSGLHLQFRYMQLSKNCIKSAPGSALRVSGVKPKLKTQNLELPQNGGGERDRTDDPLRARQVLSQLSYTPNFLGLMSLSAVALAKADGGPRWTRTTDLTIISRVL